MPDREKVIKGLECCSAMSGEECRECPYGHECRDADLPYGMPHLAAEALTLLKEQETANTGRCRIFQCKKCGFGIDDIFVTDEERYQIVPRYCPNCGRSVV